jgi:hypothetical protein
MSDKIKKIISVVLMVIPSLMLVFSAIMKLSGAQQVVEAMKKGGLGNYVLLLGIIELASVMLYLIPKTSRVGFLMLCCYLGGALSIELATGQLPSAAIFLVLLWISEFLKNKSTFFVVAKQRTY